MAVAMPADFNTVEVKGRFVAFDGVPLQGSVTFTPSIATLRSATARAIIIAKPIEGKVVDGELKASDGVTALRLFATDDPDVSLQGWHYTVKESLSGGAGRKPYAVTVPLSAAVAGVDLFALAEDSPAPSAPAISYVLLPALTSLEGRVQTLEQATGGPAGAPAEHTHDLYLTEAEGDGRYPLKAHTHTGFAATSHVHDYAEADHAHEDLVRTVNGSPPDAQGNVTVQVSGLGKVHYRFWKKLTSTWEVRPDVPAYPDAIVIAQSLDDPNAPPPTGALPYDAWDRYVEPVTPA